MHFRPLICWLDDSTMSLQSHLETEGAWIPESLPEEELPRKATQPGISHWSTYKHYIKFYCVKALRFKRLLPWQSLALLTLNNTV